MRNPRGKVFSFVGATTLCVALLLTFVNESLRAAPPVRRATENERASETRDDDAEPRERRRARFQETNDGALPESERALVDWNDANDSSLNSVDAWLDPVKSVELKKKILTTAARNRERWPRFPAIDESQLKSLGVRKLEYGRIALYTDLPSDPEVDKIPEELEKAIPLLSDYFSIPQNRFEKLRVEAFLMGDVEKFIKIRALDGSPRFLYGYSMGDRIYAKDQKNGYYNRFLLTHELTHTVMHELFGDLRPRWFSEGSAEFLALHRWDPQQGTLEIARFPESEEAYPGFGRLRQARELTRANAAPTLDEILHFEPAQFVDVATYSWCWAFVTFLNRSPKYKELAELLPYWSLLDDPNALFINAIGDRWLELENDWADFLQRVDYSYDFEASEIGDATTLAEWKDDAAQVDVDASRGWQRTGLRLTKGKTYRLKADGKYKLYVEALNKTLDFEAPGATYTYNCEKPIGRLEVVVVPELKTTTHDEVYLVEKAAEVRDDGRFRFDAFRNASFGASSALKFGGDGSVRIFDLKEEEDSTSEPQARKTSVERFYETRFPWSESLGFSTNSLELSPNVSGELYLRINAPSRDLKRNHGSVSVEIRRN